MKRIEAFIHRKKRDEVVAALRGIKSGLTVFVGSGYGDARSTQSMRGSVFEAEMLPRVLIVVFVADDLFDQVCQAILTKARTGARGDGMIVVSDISDFISIRTGQSEPPAGASAAASP